MVVVMGHTDSLNWKTMSLDLEDSFKWESDYLDRAGLVVFSDTCEDGSATVEELNLRNVDTCLISFDFLTVVDLLDGLVDTSSIQNLL